MNIVWMKDYNVRRKEKVRIKKLNKVIVLRLVVWWLFIFIRNVLCKGSLWFYKIFR